MSRVTRVTCHVLTLVLLISAASATRDRTCCRYSCDPGQDQGGADGGGQCPDWCRDFDSCVLRNGSELLDSTSSECSVSYDSKSKKKPSDISKEDCLAMVYGGAGELQLGGHTDSLPFSVLAYPFKGHNQLDSHFTGIDLRYELGQFRRLRFRVKDTNSKVCPSEGDDQLTALTLAETTCNPRCAEINVNTSGDTSPERGTFLSYDCEAGFYKQLNNWVSSSGHAYELSVCADSSCGRFLFQLPAISTFAAVGAAELGLLLVDSTEYEERDTLVVWIPGDTAAAQYNIQVFREIDNITQKEVVLTTNVSRLSSGGGMQRVGLDSLRLGSGRYQVLATPLTAAGRPLAVLTGVPLTRPSYTHTTLAFVTAVLVTLLLVGAILTLYRQWQTVAEQGAVEPGDLVAAGRMEAGKVLIITPLDNPDHVEIVKMLCRYLKDWCGIGTTYFAFDEATGIGVSQNDPWKWCQETGDQVKEDGHVVYIAGPEPSLSRNTSIFPNLEQNQAFVITKHLQTMGGEGRVMVVRFGYSSIKTIPQEVPDHLKSSSYLLPKQMNEFLIQLLQVKKKALCRALPCPLVRPDIRPSSLARAGGPQLVARVQQLVHSQAPASPARPAHSSRASAPADPVMAAETAVLLSKEIENYNKHQNESKKSDQTLSIELEPSLPSVRNMGDRDKLDVE